MDNKEIVKSQAFKVINHMIDSKSKVIGGYITMLKDVATLETKYPYSVNIRTSDEVKGKSSDAEIKYPIQYDFIDRMKSLLDAIEKERLMISDLQTFKLNLLNDYDFTHGDDSLQKEIFGDVA